MKLIFTLTVLLLVSFTNYDSDKNKRAYVDGEFYYEFSILETNPKINFNKEVEYYWYRLNKIHTSYYDVGGKLLDGEYQKRSLNLSST